MRAYNEKPVLADGFVELLIRSKIFRFKFVITYRALFILFNVCINGGSAERVPTLGYGGVLLFVSDVSLNISKGH